MGLFSFVALLLGLCFTSASGQRITPANRAIRGWRASSISANRFNQTAVIVDDYHWLNIIHDNPPHRPGPPHLEAPWDGLNQFNVSDGQFIYDVATLDNHQAWISVMSFSGRVNRNVYIALIDLTNNKVIANISTTKFSPSTQDSGEPPFLGVDSTNNLYAINGNSVWAFAPSGKQVNYFQLQDTAAPIVSLDIAEDDSLWILEDFNSTTQQNRLVHYDPSGLPLAAFNLDFKNLNESNWLIDVAVSSVTNEAYITAYGVPFILCWDVSQNTHCRDIHIDGGREGRDVSPYFAPQLTLFNKTILIVVDNDLDAAEAYDLSRRYHSFDIFSVEAPLEGASTIKATRDGLLVTLDYEAHADVVLIDSFVGHLLTEFERPRGRDRFAAFTSGIAVDSRGTVFISKQSYDFEKGTALDQVDIYENRRHRQTVNVSASGPLAFDESTQIVWIADDMQKQPVITAYFPNNGSTIKSFTFQGFDEEHRVTDLQIVPFVPFNSSVAWFAATDYISQQLIVESEKGQVVSILQLPAHPRSFCFNTYETFVVLETYGNRTVPSDTFIGVFDGNGRMVEQLVAPLGWPQAEITSVTVDSQGTVFAVSARYGAVLEWTRDIRPSARNTLASTWFANQLDVDKSDIVTAFE